MPRYTLIITPVPLNIPNEHIMELIRLGFFQRQANIDFATEKEIIEAQEFWEDDGENKRAIMEYEPNGIGFNVLHIRPLGLDTSILFPEHPKMFPRQNGEYINMHRAMENLLNLVQVLDDPAEDAPEEHINPPQSTHKESVHKTVTASLQNLNTRYHSVQVEDNIIAIKDFANTITAENFPEINKYMREAAKRFINSMDKLYAKKENASGISIKRILALVWAGIKDETSGARLVKEQEALEKFIKHLYEIQRGYNLNAEDEDNAEAPDRPICAAGTINKLIDVLNAGVHQDVSIRYVTKETAGVKLKILIKEHALKFVKHAENKKELIEAIQQSPQGDVGYEIPEVILETIKKSVEEAFYKEFEDDLSPETLQEIFAGVYEYVLVDSGDLSQLQKLPILNEDSVVIKRIFVAIERLKYYGKEHELVDSEKHGAAIELASTLEKMVRTFIAENDDAHLLQKNFEEFKQGFSTTLHTHDELFSLHRHYSRVILANILVALTGVGFFLLGGKMLHSYATSGKIEGFFAHTKGEEMIGHVAEDLNNIKLQMN